MKYCIIITENAIIRVQVNTTAHWSQRSPLDHNLEPDNVAALTYNLQITHRRFEMELSDWIVTGTKPCPRFNTQCIIHSSSSNLDLYCNRNLILTVISMISLHLGGLLAWSSSDYILCKVEFYGYSAIITLIYHNFVFVRCLKCMLQCYKHPWHQDASIIKIPAGSRHPGAL